ncbi:MAG: MBL fold metallo-hydrolase [Bacteroidetes bacterium]|nr:MBL fold metallo-hydrolase [Bacteroidota bacterium]
MKITFHGAAQTVTGSKHLITLNNGKKLLLDCGLFQGLGSDNDTFNRHFGFAPHEIDYLILSHAHIDHSGNIPYLCAQGYKGKIFATPATIDLCEILLQDSAHIHEQDVVFLNKKRAKKNQKPLEALYTIEDAKACMNQFIPVVLDTWERIDDDIEFMFTDAGHILGSAAVNINIYEDDKATRVFFSGDIGRYSDKIMRPPQPFPQADVIICESTYGDSLHDKTEDAESHMARAIMETCFKRKGRVIIPAFSLGRTQELVYTIDRLITNKIIPPIDVYIDSPLSVSATNIMRKHTESFNDSVKEYMKRDDDPFGFEKCHYIKEVAQSKALNSTKNPGVIIAASGMTEAGRIKHHIANNVEDNKDLILIVGYLPSESIGGQLLQGAEEIRVFGEKKKVRCAVDKIGAYSAHADYGEMLQYLSCQNKSKVKKIFLVHGEIKRQTAWKNHLLDNGYTNIEIPSRGQSFTI